MFGSKWREENRERNITAALIRQLVSSGKISPESGLKMTILENGKLGYMEEDPNPIVPTANGVPMEKENQEPQMRTRPMTFVSDDLENSPLFQRNRDTGKLERVPPTPGLKNKKQILDFNPPSEGSTKEPTEVSMAKETYKEFLRKSAAGEPLSQTFLKQVDAAAPLLNLVKVRSKGEAKKSFFRGKPTGEFDAGPTTYKPAAQVTEDEWNSTAEEELRDALVQNYPDMTPKEINALLTPERINAAKKQLKGARRK